MNSRERLQDEQTVLAAWGDIIRRYRSWQGISRRELALRAGISPVYLGEIERGEKDLSSHSLCLLADALGVGLSELYLRVGAQLHGATAAADGREQTAIPLQVREGAGEYLPAVPLARDDGAFDLYKLARSLPGEQQIALLILAQALGRAEMTPG
jgi:transcriptional regulator with XRE-family HTH domain